MDFNEIYGSALREADYVNNDTKETVAFKAAELIREYFNAIDKSIEIDISENGEFDTTDGANGEGMIDSVNVHVGKDGWLQVFSYENTDNEVFISLASLDFDHYPNDLISMLKEDLEKDGYDFKTKYYAPEARVKVEDIQNCVNALTEDDDSIDDNGKKLDESVKLKETENTVVVKETMLVENGYVIIDPCYALSEEMYDDYMKQVDDGVVNGVYKHDGVPYMILAGTGADGVYVDNYSEKRITSETASIAIINLDFVEPSKKELEDKNVSFIWVGDYSGKVGLYQDKEIIFIDEFTEQKDRPNRICKNYLFTALMFNPLKESLMNKNFENGKPYCAFSEKDFKDIHDEAQNIVYHGWQKWVQRRNPEPDKLHNKFAKEEKEGIYYGHCVPTIPDAN